MEMSTIFLSSLNGYEFEDLCAKLLLYDFDNVQKTQVTNDYGKDIIAYKNDCKYIIECKHFISGGTVGRPVVQKLHSAMIHENTNHGIIITTGKVAQNAIKYINELVEKNCYIKIMTIDDLVLLARKSNIHLLKRSGATISCKILPELPQNSLIEWYITEAKKLLNTSINISDYIQVKSLMHLRHGLCEVKYSVDSYHSTSAMQYTINKSGKYIFENTNFIKDEFISLIDQENFITEVLDISDINNRYVKSLSDAYIFANFDTFISELKDKTITNAQQQHSVNVSYYGKNNNKYVKTCTPRIGDINIDGFQMIMQNHYSILLELFGINYEIEGFIYYNGGSILSKPIEFLSSFSKTKIKHGDGAICDLCYKIINVDNKLGEYYKCKKCKLNLCFEHTYFKKNIFMKEFFCEKCQNSLPAIAQKTTYKKRLRRLNKVNCFIGIGVIFLISFSVINCYTPNFVMQEQINNSQQNASNAVVLHKRIKKKQKINNKFNGKIEYAKQ